MMKKFNWNTGRTLLTELVCGASADELLAGCKNAAADRADGIGIGVHYLPPELRNAVFFEKIAKSVPLPFMFTFYRSDKYFQGGESEEKRAQMLLEAAEAGVGLIDVVGDLYDPSPDERSRNPEAIRKQSELIEQLHRAGAEVIMSSHPKRRMTLEEVSDQLQDFASRGADVVKLVAKADTPEEFGEALTITAKLPSIISRPSVYLCGGCYGTMQRFAGLRLGVSMTFCVGEYVSHHLYGQPRLAAFQAVEAAIPLLKTP